MRQEVYDLRKLGDNAYKFLNECNGHTGVLFEKNVESHINEMWRLWHSLDGTWDESYRYTKDYLTKMCEDMRKKKIRTKGKCFPLKSGNSICNQMNRIVVLAGGYSYGNPNVHLKRAISIVEHYGKNIAATKEWKDAYKAGYDLVTSDITKVGFSSVESEAVTSGYAKAYAVKFPREVYAAH